MVISDTLLRCGYDFVSRLEEQGDFLQRYDTAPEKGSKAYKKLIEAEKADYEAKLDKLACPKCRKTQTFDEYYEKIRSCRACKEKFTQLNVSNTAAFEAKMKKEEEKRLARAKAVEDAMYGNLGKLPHKVII